MASSKTPKGGGVKGFFTRAAASFQQGFQLSRDWGYWLAMKSGRIGLVLASTSMVVLMPLIFEINREITVRHFYFFCLEENCRGCFHEGSCAFSFMLLFGKAHITFIQNCTYIIFDS